MPPLIFIAVWTDLFILATAVVAKGEGNLRASLAQPITAETVATDAAVSPCLSMSIIRSMASSSPKQSKSILFLTRNELILRNDGR